MANKVIHNYIYNLLFQAVSFLIPLVTIPYLARVLGADGVGKYAYFYSIVYLFSQFITLGLQNYGNRCIAQCLNDKDKLNKTFSELFVMELACGSIVMTIYIIYGIIWSTDRIMTFCMIPILISSAFDVNWFLYGKEKFKLISIRGVVIKVLTALSFFLFIHQRSDVLLYAVIMTASFFLTNAIAWPIVYKEVKLVRVTYNSVKKHIGKNLVYFIPTIAVTVYRTLDKVMLGSLSNVTQVGLFENAEKIVSVLLSVIVALGTVMLPRISALVEEKDEKAIGNMMVKTFVFVSLLSSVFSYGVFAVSEDLVLWFLGDEFEGSVRMLQLLCLTIPFIGFANIVRTQILIPQGFDKPYVVSCVTGAIINLISNFILINPFGGVGAAISTILAEASVCVIQYIYCHNNVKIYLGKSHLQSFVFLQISGIIVLITLLFLKRMITIPHLQSLILLTLIGGLLYLLFIMVQLFILKDKNLMSLFKTIKK